MIDPMTRKRLALFAARFDTPEGFYRYIVDRSDDLFLKTGMKASMKDGILHIDLSDFTPGLNAIVEPSKGD